MEWWQLNGPWLIALLVAVFGVWEGRRARLQGWQGERVYSDTLQSAMLDLEADYNDLYDHAAELRAELRVYAPDLPVRPLPRRRRRSTVTGPPRLREYRALLLDRLSEDEIRNAAFDLGLDPNGSTKGVALRRLIEYLEDRKQEDKLIAWVGKNRPDIELR